MNLGRRAGQLNDKDFQALDGERVRDEIDGKPMDLAPSIVIDVFLFLLFGALGFVFTRDLFSNWILPALIAVVFGGLVAGIREFIQIKKRERYYQ